MVLSAEGGNNFMMASNSMKAITSPLMILPVHNRDFEISFVSIFLVFVRKTKVWWFSIFSAV
jgi:hypothetical protein